MAVLDVKQIQSHEVEQWILRKHYARRMPQVSFAFGLYRGSLLIGVVTYGIPASRPLCVGVCGKEYATDVLELNRLVLEENGKNHASILIGRSIRLLPRPKILVSYADTGQDHIGYVYQATNWIYTGKSVQRFDRVSFGSKTHPRRAFDVNGVQVLRHSKHRYVYFIGNKKEVKTYKSKLNYQIQSYPKGESIRYDTSERVETQLLLV